MGEGEERDDMSWQQMADQLSKRIDAVERSVAAFMGRDPEKVAADPKLFGIGITAWVALGTTFAAVLGAIGGIILGVKP